MHAFVFMVVGGEYIRNQAGATSANLGNFLRGKSIWRHIFTEFNKIKTTSAYNALVMELS